jgi:SOS response regulatory protein OraA/RecX
MIEKIALKLLSIKSRTAQELKKKLILKGFELQDIEAVIKKMTDEGYLDDTESAQRKFEIYVQKGYGPRWIALKMGREGLKMPLYPADLQRKVIKKILDTFPFQRKDKLQKRAALQRRGFTPEVIVEMTLSN